MNKEQMIQKIYEVICPDKIWWHEESCMIWDVLDHQLKYRSLEYYHNPKLFDLREKKRLSIDDQSEECIKFVHSLIQ